MPEIIDPKKDLHEAIRPLGMMTGVRCKNCKWCSTTIHPIRGKGTKVCVFCSTDCRLEYNDWRYIVRRRKNVECTRIRNNKKKVPRVNKGRDKEKIRVRKKAYYQKNKEKIKKQMVEIRKRNKLKKTLLK